MNFKAKVTKLEKQKDEEQLFALKIETYKEKLEGKFTFSELRELIEIIDNAI